MRVTITSPDLKERVAELSAMGRRSHDRNILDRPEVRRELEHASARRFSRGLRQAGREWRLEKRRRGLADRPMRATDTAFQALTKGAGPAASSLAFEANRTGITWGVKRGRSDLYYLHVHARGVSARGKKVKRKVVVIDKPAREGIAEQMLQFILEPITGGGR